MFQKGLNQSTAVALLDSNRASHMDFLDKENIHPLKLPTLALNKYKNQNLTMDFRNPFKFHKDTEKLLV
jgi:hypothetical protein